MRSSNRQLVEKFAHLPHFRRPFDQSEFRGCIQWKPELSEITNIFHGCHEKELLRVLKRNRLLLRSEYSYIGIRKNARYSGRLDDAEFFWRFTRQLFRAATH